MSDLLNIKPIESWLDSKYPLLVAGPCSLESEEQVIATARELAKDERVQVFRGGVWKPRTRPGSFEGVGTIGLEWLQMVKKETGMMVGTEIANAQHAEAALKADLDVLWIGARTTTSPFSIQEIAEALRGTNKVIMVKNPVNPDLQLWMGALERLSKEGQDKLVAIHRGFTPFKKTKYRNYPNWRTVIEMKRLMPNLPIICDPSHIAGSREFLQEISQKSFDIGLDGLMLESHIDPSVALSDKDQQLTPAALEELISTLTIRYENIDNPSVESQLSSLRDRIDSIDFELMELLASRFNLTQEIGEIKKGGNVTALQINRWSEMMDTRGELSQKLSLDSDLIKSIFQNIHEESVKIQSDILKK